MEFEDENYNWIFENAKEEICCFCKANPYDTVKECLENIEDCPFYDEHEKIREKSEELLQMIARLSKRTHANQDPYELDDEIEEKPLGYRDDIRLWRVV